MRPRVERHGATHVRSPLARQPTPIERHAIALSWAMEDLARRRERGQRLAPARIGFVHDGGIMLCAVLTRDGVLACGAHTSPTNEQGTWQATPAFADRLRRSLEAAAGWTEIDPDSGLPAVA